MALQFVSSFTMYCLIVLSSFETGSVAEVVKYNLTDFANLTILNDSEPLYETLELSKPNAANASLAENVTYLDMKPDKTDLSDTKLTFGSNDFGNSVNGSSLNNSLLEEEKTENEKTVDLLGMVTEPIFFVTAVVGNSLSIRVLTGKDFRVMPVSFTLVCLAISDMIVTLLHPFNRAFFRELVKLDIRSSGGEAGCKAFYWTYKTAKMTSSWFIVFVCIERFLVVWCPLKVKRISTRKNTLGGILLIYAIIGTYTGIWTFASGLKNGKICVPDLKAKGLEEITAIFLVGGTTLYSGLPSLLMIVFTGLIIIKLIQSHFLRRKISANASDNSATVRLTTMLVGITIAYTVLVNPHAILHNVAYALGEDFFETQNPALKTGRQVAQVMEQINYSINFFLYVLCSKQFRKRTAEILGLRCCSSKSDTAPTSFKTNSTVTS